mmetsp:Transcript_27495/g.88370  ORF Transcript_27495/g.88370 Transcript_27495/m.88370 type:complete len:205 (+) Transcript_27495:27-641(+)
MPQRRLSRACHASKRFAARRSFALPGHSKNGGHLSPSTRYRASNGTRQCGRDERAPQPPGATRRAPHDDLPVALPVIIVADLHLVERQRRDVVARLQLLGQHQQVRHVRAVRVVATVVRQGDSAVGGEHEVARQHVHVLALGTVELAACHLLRRVEAKRLGAPYASHRAKEAEGSVHATGAAPAIRSRIVQVRQHLRAHLFAPA